MWASSWWPRRVPWPPRHGSVQHNVKVPMIWRHPSRCLPSMSLGLHSFRRIVWWHEYIWNFKLLNKSCLKVVQVFLKWASMSKWRFLRFYNIYWNIVICIYIYIVIIYVEESFCRPSSCVSLLRLLFRGPFPTFFGRAEDSLWPAAFEQPDDCCPWRATWRSPDFFSGPKIFEDFFLNKILMQIGGIISWKVEDRREDYGRFGKILWCFLVTSSHNRRRIWRMGMMLHASAHSCLVRFFFKEAVRKL